MSEDLLFLGSLELVNLFNQETNNGDDMSKYTAVRPSMT